MEKVLSLRWGEGGGERGTIKRLLFEYSLSLLAQTSNELPEKRKRRSIIWKLMASTKYPVHLFGEKIRGVRYEKCQFQEKTRNSSIWWTRSKQNIQLTKISSSPFHLAPYPAEDVVGRGRVICLMVVGMLVVGEGGATSSKRGYYQHGEKNFISFSESIALSIIIHHSIMKLPDQIPNVLLVGHFTKTGKNWQKILRPYQWWRATKFSSLVHHPRFLSQTTQLESKSGVSNSTGNRGDVGKRYHRKSNQKNLYQSV